MQAQSGNPYNGNHSNLFCYNVSLPRALHSLLLQLLPAVACMSDKSAPDHSRPWARRGGAVSAR